ncbi:MAG: hypothetical protein Q7T54_05810 [Candidatus Levybacteria bacterium]|nr:hypothetical protein [Candidatus Levybacteria bacterium]
MSRSAVTWDTRFQEKPTTWTSLVLLLAGILAIGLLAGGCIFGGDDPNRANETSEAISSLTDTSSDEDVRSAVKNEVGNDNDARKIATAIISARTRGASMTEIAGKLDVLDDTDTKQVVSTINQIRANQAASGGTATPTAGSLNETQVRTVAEETARKAVTEAGGNLPYAQVQMMIDKAVANALAQYKQTPNLTEAQIRTIIIDTLKNLKGGDTPPPVTAVDTLKGCNQAVKNAEGYPGPTTAQAKLDTGIDVQRLGTECAAWVFRDPKAQTHPTTCKTGYVCTFTLSGGAVKVFVGDNKSQQASAAIYRWVNGYSANDKVRENPPCELARSEDKFGRGEDPSFPATAGNFTCTGSTTTTTTSNPSTATCGKPEVDLGGGTWVRIGDRMSLQGTATIHGHPAWTVHTNAHPGDPGLPPESSETTSGASAYCDPYKG